MTMGVRAPLPVDPLSRVKNTVRKLDSLGAIREIARVAIENPDADLKWTFKEIERLAKQGRRA